MQVLGKNLLLSGCHSFPTSWALGFFSSIVFAFMKWFFIKFFGRSMKNFESGYIVETVFDGSTLGIVVDKLLETKMNHPKGFTEDDREKIYVIDTINMTIRKVSDAMIIIDVLENFYIRVTTIARGKWSHGEGHVNGVGENAIFPMILKWFILEARDMTSHFDCAYQYGSGLLIAVLLATSFFAYMLKSTAASKHSTTWPQQDNFMIPKEDEPPLIEIRILIVRKTCSFINHQRYQSFIPCAYYEQSFKETNEIISEAV
ncbi:hypothetical protein K2173_008270 [Erythroxylum novogranatense]|uniref:Uncharacterized protein n=1 Tax=Erythroxylum novogranatense TaxID=1862640 RepID=A0AAV8U3D1_9ROSI|nr:hypothetical protein K2173_008270 [Erythroxylum novogranatense]